MNSTQENKISMYYKVNLFLTNNLTDLNSITILESKRDLFVDLLSELEANEQEASEDISGYSVQKQNLRIQLRDAALVVAGGLHAFFIDQGDPAGAAKAKTTKSSLDALRDVDFAFRCDKLADLANPYILGVLPQYGVTGPKFTSLLNLVGNFKEIMQNPADQRAESSAAGMRVDTIMTSIDNLLIIIDGLMATVAITLPNLYNQYLLDRSIDDSTSGGTAPDFTGMVAGNSFQEIMTLPYSAGRSFKAKNNGAEPLNWCLSTDPLLFTTPPKTLAAGATSTLLSSTLAPNGDILLFENTSPDAIEIEITVIE